MKIPTFMHTRIVDDNGIMTPMWKMLFIQLFDQMQLNLSDEGFVVPSLDHVDIVKLEKPFELGGSVDGTLIYDRTNNLLKVKQNGDFKNINTS